LAQQRKVSRGPRKGWTPEALARREKALGPNPWGGYNHNNLGCEFFRMGAWLHAVHEFERAVEINPWNASFKANLARAYLAADELQKAQSSALAAMRQDASLAQAWFASALTQERLGDASVAIEHYRECLALKPALGLKREAEENLELLAHEESMKGRREGT